MSLEKAIQELEKLVEYDQREEALARLIANSLWKHKNRLRYKVVCRAQSPDMKIEFVVYTNGFRIFVVELDAFLRDFYWDS